MDDGLEFIRAVEISSRPRELIATSTAAPLNPCLSVLTSALYICAPSNTLMTNIYLYEQFLFSILLFISRQKQPKGIASEMSVTGLEALLTAITRGRTKKLTTK